MQSREELMLAIRGLRDQTELLSEPCKEGWLGWLKEYDGPGFYGRKNPDRSARFIFNSINSASMIIWLAEAIGIEDRLLKRALKAADINGYNKQRQAAAVRAVIPWELVEIHLEQSKTKAQRHFIAYHNTDKRGPYRPRKVYGTFLTNKNFRVETLQGQHLWIFEGSGLPKVYRLASHGTITNIARDAAGQATVLFKIEGPRAPVIVTSVPWFERLLVQQRSFANGFSSLNDLDIIQSLQQIADLFSSEASAIKSGPPPTTTEALVDARLGQGQFRAALEREWNGACAVTGCRISEILRASHIKPWETSNDSERLDSENGLLLSAHIDALFDKGLVSFANDGKMLLSDQISIKDRMYFRLPKSLRLKPSKRRIKFLEYHREHRFEC
jgi:HNH endonuclease